MDDKIDGVTSVKIVFVGGAGRCGTNILKSIFSKHSRIATLPFEHRFLIDPDGIIDFYSIFHRTWSPYVADKRLKRLEDILNEVSRDRRIHRMLGRILSLINKDGKLISPKKYIGWELEKWCPNLKRHNLELISKLRKFTYRGVWPGTDSYTFKPQMYYCGPRKKEELTEILGDYIRRVIRDLLCEYKKECFIEDNTWNIFFARELLELLPEAKIIHIHRDIKDATASCKLQRWCPSDGRKVADWYATMMKYWLIVRKDLSLHSYWEVKFEDLITSPEEELRKLCEFVDLPFEKSMLDVDLSEAHIGRWKEI